MKKLTHMSPAGAGAEKKAIICRDRCRISCKGSPDIRFDIDFSLEM